MRFDTADVLTILGVILMVAGLAAIAVGVGRIYPPAGVITAGIAAAAVGVLTFRHATRGA